MNLYRVTLLAEALEDMPRQIDTMVMASSHCAASLKAAEEQEKRGLTGVKILQTVQLQANDPAPWNVHN